MRDSLALLFSSNMGDLRALVNLPFCTSRLFAIGDMMSVVRGFCDDDDDATIEFCWSFVLHRSLTMST